MLREKVSKGLEPAQRAPKAHTEEKERGPPSSHWPSLAYSGAPRQVLGQLGGGGGGGCDGGGGGGGCDGGGGGGDWSPRQSHPEQSQPTLVR